MIAHAAILLVVYFGGIVMLGIPLGRYMARVYCGEATTAQRILGPCERALHRVAGVKPSQEMTWKQYAYAALVFNLFGLLAAYLIQRVQGSLPLNPQDLPSVGPEVSFNTAVSFASNTNWQAYGGETTMSYLTQMLALTVQNFVSAATGMAVMAAVVRGFARKSSSELGNFWVDLIRTTIYVLIPLSFVFALVLISQGVVQTFGGPVTAGDQTLAVGPAASQIAIKQLGTNGGGFFNVNSAHPFENPTPLSNFLEMLAILLIPGALCFTFGELVKDRRQGWALFLGMTVILLPLMIGTIAAEQVGTPALSPNMEGKEVRFGIVESAMWANATTAASNGSVNSMHDSYTPLGGMAPIFLIDLGEIVFGGVGSGLYGILLYAIVAVFIAGLMVGRTPEYLGKKIEAYEMKMASLGILLPAASVLVGTAIACVTREGVASVANPGAHGFSEILYAFSSGSNNNGSAFAGLTASGPFYATAIGIAMLIGRYWVIIPALALGGSLAKKKQIPVSAGTMPTHGPMFVLLLVGTILLVGALTFVPALALGPIVEHLQMIGANP